MRAAPGQSVPPVRDIVLVGGGHSHVQVLRSLAMTSWPGVRATVVSREVHTPYSGMLPGLIAGHYTFDESHIDLGPLCLAAGARLVADEVVGLDLSAKTVHFASRPPLRFDLLSLDTGAVPAAGDVALGANVVPVKPISAFLPGWARVVRALREAYAASAPSLVVVGGGAGGVELALAVQHVLERDGIACRIRLVSAGSRLLEGHNPRVASFFARRLAARGIEVELSFDVVRADDGVVVARDGRRRAADHVLWVTGVLAPPWLGAAGLEVDAGGFVRVDATLCSLSHPFVYAAGDVASLVRARPKSGVFAVRAGPFLAHNLRAAIAGSRARPYRPQARFLALISEGERRAVASRGALFAEGAWVWRWKDWIDRRFMARFRVPARPAVAPALPAELAADLPAAERCGGCGAKLSASLLHRVLERLPLVGPVNGSTVEIGIGDDAAVLRAEGGRVVVTVDAFRAFIDDLYRFGRIAAHHALGDVYAMNGRPRAAFALVTVPLAAEALMEDDLLQVMRGAVDVLQAEGVVLAGGHSSEGGELALGFAVFGDTPGDGQTLWRKGGLRNGDALVLTKAIGTGVVLAGRMRGLARSSDVLAALAAMDRTNRDALEVLCAHGASTGTDVTGFGLLGHLAEMLRASGLAADLDLLRIPLLPGALELSGAGVESALAPSNAGVLADFDTATVRARARLRLLVDPQTSGGLIAGVPVARAAPCVEALRRLGFDAAEIGHTHCRARPGSGTLRDA